MLLGVQQLLRDDRPPERDTSHQGDPDSSPSFVLNSHVSLGKSPPISGWSSLASKAGPEASLWSLPALSFNGFMLAYLAQVIGVICSFPMVEKLEEPAK